MGIFSARSCTIARLPLERRWNRGNQRPAPDDLLRAGDVERARSDPERTAVRAYREPGESRRGREGMLFLSGFHAHAQLHENALQICAGGVSVWTADRGKSAPRA